MVRPDGRLLHTRCHDDILPVFCPTGQIDFVKSKKPNADKGPATVHGVVFANFVLPASDMSGRAPIQSGPERPEHSPQLSTFRAAMKASCGMSTLPNCRIFFLPSFCFSRSFRLRVMSPP
jgi:hypothetical protein